MQFGIVCVCIVVIYDSTPVCVFYQTYLRKYKKGVQYINNRPGKIRTFYKRKTAYTLLIKHPYTPYTYANILHYGLKKKTDYKLENYNYNLCILNTHRYTQKHRSTHTHTQHINQYQCIDKHIKVIRRSIVTFYIYFFLYRLTIVKTRSIYCKEYKIYLHIIGIVQKKKLKRRKKFRLKFKLKRLGNRQHLHTDRLLNFLF